MSYDWKNILLQPDQPIRDALELIDRESLRIALVVDADLHLLGVVTDGDVRRGLLKGYTVDSRVDEIIQSNPRYIKKGDYSIQKIIEYREEDYRIIPVVNEEFLRNEVK